MSRPNDDPHLDAVSLWRSLGSFLQVTFEMKTPAPTETRGPLRLEFTVANTAPSGPDRPEVVFEDISIRINNSTKAGPGALANGQSFTFWHECDAREVAALNVKVEGSVSRRRFFRTEKSADIPAIYVRPAIQDYLRSFNNASIHAGLDVIKGSVLTPGPDTTLAQLQALTASCSKALSEIKRTDQMLRGIQQSLLPVRAKAHLETGYHYLAKVAEACKRVEEASATSRVDHIATASEQIRALSTEAAEINGLTERLASDYDLADDQTNYQYRTR